MKCMTMRSILCQASVLAGNGGRRRYVASTPFAPWVTFGSGGRLRCATPARAVQGTPRMNIVDHVLEVHWSVHSRVLFFVCMEP